MQDDQPTPDHATEPEATASSPETIPARSTVALFELDGLTKSYGDVTALGPVTLTVEGGCIALLGPNGAGKSTLIRLLLGLARPQAGSAFVLGHPPGPSTRRRIGYAPEGDALFPGHTGVQAVAYAGQLCGMDRTHAMQRAHQVLDYVGLADERYRTATTYSSGMRQRLKLAQALVHDPAILILDEPTEAVDPQSRRDLLDLILDLTTRHGIHVLLSTHLLADVEAVAQTAIVLDRGQVVAHGPLSSLKASRHPGFAVRVNRDPEALRRQLESIGCQASMARGELRIQGDIDAAGILREATHAGVVVRHLAPLEVTMQEAFQQAIQGGKA